MEVSITPDYITMDMPFTQKECKYLMDLMMGDYLLPSQPEVYKKLSIMKQRLERCQGIDYGC